MAKLESPSAERNKLPIWEQVVEKRLLPQWKKDNHSNTPLKVLEVAAGCGVHTQFFAQQLAQQLSAPVVWQSTDPQAASLASQGAYIAEIATDDNKAADIETSAMGAWKVCGTVQFAKPRFLTLHENGIQETDTAVALTDQQFDWIWNVNMIHISPWTATQGLMKMAGEKLKPHTGRLILYGPYRVNGHMVESNQRFDLSLKSRDPSWGVRNLEDVVAEATKHGMELQEVIEMPANNLSVILCKTG